MATLEVEASTRDLARRKQGWMLKHQDRRASVTECGCKVLKPWFLRMEMFTYFFISNKSFVDYLTLIRNELSY